MFLLEMLQHVISPAKGFFASQVCALNDWPLYTRMMDAESMALQISSQSERTTCAIHYRAVEAFVVFTIDVFARTGGSARCGTRNFRNISTYVLWYSLWNSLGQCGQLRRGSLEHSLVSDREISVVKGLSDVVGLSPVALDSDGDGTKGVLASRPSAIVSGELILIGLVVEHWL